MITLNPLAWELITAKIAKCIQKLNEETQNDETFQN